MDDFFKNYGYKDASEYLIASAEQNKARKPIEEYVRNEIIKIFGIVEDLQVNACTISCSVSIILPSSESDLYKNCITFEYFSQTDKLQLYHGQYKVYLYDDDTIDIRNEQLYAALIGDNSFLLGLKSQLRDYAATFPHAFDWLKPPK